MISKTLASNESTENCLEEVAKRGVWSDNWGVGHKNPYILDSKIESDDFGVFCLRNILIESKQSFYVENMISNCCK